jgi:hypothetical protein
MPPIKKNATKINNNNNNTRSTASVSTAKTTRRGPRNRITRQRALAIRMPMYSGPPVALGSTQRASRPRLESRADGTRIRKVRELVTAQILGSTAWTLADIGFTNMNPGLNNVFPWGSGVSKNFQQYKVLGVSLDYVPICGADTRGDVTFTPIYDATSGAPTTELAAANIKNSVTTNVWRPQHIRLDTRAIHSGIARKWIRSSSVGTMGNDLKTFDMCQFYVSTVNCLDTNPVGKLYITYDIQLFDEVTDSGIGQTVPLSIAVFQNNSSDNNYALGNTVNNNSAIPFSGNITPASATAMGIFLSNANKNFNFKNSGTYRIDWKFSAFDGNNSNYQYCVKIYRNGVPSSADPSVIADESIYELAAADNDPIATVTAIVTLTAGDVLSFIFNLIYINGTPLPNPVVLGTPGLLNTTQGCQLIITQLG